MIYSKLQIKILLDHRTVLLKMSRLVYLTLPTSVLIFIWLTSICNGYFTRDDRFMSDVNLEFFYVVEENALSNADVLLREDYFGVDDEEEETEEEHLAHSPNLTSLQSIIDETKAIHKLAGPNLKAFLGNPINVYHMFRRLDRGWRDGLNLLLQTKPCKEWNIPSMVGRLRYLQENLPGKVEVDRVIEYIATLQKLHKLQVKEIARGEIGNAVSFRPLGLDELYEIVKVLRNKDDMKTALEWLKLLNEQIRQLSPAQKEGLDFNAIDVLNPLASAYYYVKEISKALETTKQVLQIDPNNVIAQNNRLFFTNKLEQERERGRTVTLREQLSKYEHLCHPTRPKKLSRKKCRLVRVGLMFYKMEPIRHRPYVVLFHDVVRNQTTETIQNYAHEMQTEIAWISEDKFTPPELKLELDTVYLRKESVKEEVLRLSTHLSALTSAMQKTVSKWRTPQIINVGLEGVHLADHKELHFFIRIKSVKRRGNVGAFFTFLNKVNKGGEVILPDINVKLQPEQGSVVFYYSTLTTPHSFCPVLGSSLWVAVQTVFEEKLFCVDADEWL